jgi:hypothetical protein
MYFHTISNEEKFALADFAACKVEQATGKKMTPTEYEKFVWDFISTINSPYYHD